MKYTVRGIPIEVDRALRVRASQRQISINRLIVEELTKAMIGRQQFADFSDLVGRWSPDDEFDDIVRSQREVNADDWQ